jgi:hypothetical protein
MVCPFSAQALASREETEGDKIFLRLKDGNRLLAYEPVWERSL